MRHALVLVAVLGACVASGCVANDPPAVNWGYGQYGYGYGYGPMGPRASVGEPSAEYVSGLPPDPLYEQEPAAPGDGYVWIDGYWHWNGDEWVWVGGRWEQQQEGYVYVEPYYNQVDGAYIYTPGYWRSGANLPAGWVVARDPGTRRPPVVRPPKTYVPTQPHPIVGRPVGGNGGGGIVPPPRERSPYGPVAPSTGINQPGGGDPYGPQPPIETVRPREDHPVEGGGGEHEPTYGHGGNGGPEPQEPVIVPREPVHYIPPPSAPPSGGGGRSEPPLQHGPPPSAPPPQHGAPPAQHGTPPPAHATSGHK